MEEGWISEWCLEKSLAPISKICVRLSVNVRYMSINFVPSYEYVLGLVCYCS